MHIADGVASIPVLVGGGVLTAGGVAMGLSRLKDEQIPRAALMASVIFVGSVLIRLPIGPSSEHPVLNGLAGLLLGWTAMPVFLIALFLQALLFQFGGITSLGINTLTMAVPAVLCHYCFGPMVRRASTPRSAFAVGVTTALLALSLSFALWMTALLMSGKALLVVIKIAALPHLVLMVAEAVFTGFIVSFLWRVYPRIFDMTGLRSGGRIQGASLPGGHE